MTMMINGFARRYTPTNGTVTCNMIREPCTPAQRGKLPLLKASRILSSFVARIARHVMNYKKFEQQYCCRYRNY